MHTHSNARSVTHFFCKFAGLTRSSSEPLQGRVKGGITILQFHVTGPGSRTQSTRPSYCGHLSTSPETTGGTQHNRRCPRVQASSLVLHVLSCPLTSSHVLPRPPSSSHVFSRRLTSSLVLPRPPTSPHVLPRPLTKRSLQTNNVLTIICFDRFLVTAFLCVCFFFVFLFCYVSFIVSLVKLFVRHAFFPFSCK